METFGDTIITSMSSSTVTFLTDFVETYWPTMLTIGAVLFLGRWFLRLAGIAR